MILPLEPSISATDKVKFFALNCFINGLIGDIVKSPVAYKNNLLITFSFLIAISSFVGYPFQTLIRICLVFTYEFYLLKVVVHTVFEY